MTSEQIAELVRLSDMPACTNQSLQTTLHVYQAPNHLSVLAMDYVNSSAASCALRPERGPDQGPVLEMKPGATAYTSLRWYTQPQTPTTNCHSLSTLRLTVRNSPNGILLASKSLLPQQCSDVQYGPYLPGHFAPDWKTSTDPVQPLPAPSTLSSSKDTYIDREFIDLKLKLSTLPSSGKDCPVLIEKIVDENGFIRMDDIESPGNKKCQRWWVTRDPTKEHPDEFGIDSGERSRWGGLGPRTFSVVQLTSPAPDGEIHMVESNPVTIKVVDVATMKRNWGATKLGMRADLTLDKLTYPLGQDIPLHIAIENVSNANPIYSEPFLPSDPELSDAMASIHIVVQDEDGPLQQFSTWDELDTSHGQIACPNRIEQGKTLTFEKSLARIGLLPRAPGKYKITLTWSPYTANSNDCGLAHAFQKSMDGNQIDFQALKPFASVNSKPIYITITGDAVHDGLPTVPAYTDWKKHFSLVDTTFGENTALLDRTAHLEWLRLNFTAGLSYNQVVVQTAAGRQFEGWRYATADELKKFFSDFIGKGDSTNDLAIEGKLQRLIGGPLFTIGTPHEGQYVCSSLALVADKTELGRELRGYIEDDWKFGANVHTNIEGYRSDSFQDYGTHNASWLVRVH